MKNKLLIFASTSILVLTVCGYQFITTLFLPATVGTEVATQTVTIPYRIIVLFLCLYVILFSNHTLRINNNVKLFFFFWAIYLIRIFYDIYIRPDAVASTDYNTNTVTFIVGIIFPVTLAIYRGFLYIDFQKAFIVCFWVSTCTLLLSLYNNEMLLADELTQRINGNVALNTISFGHLGLTNILLSYLLLDSSKVLTIRNVALVLVMLLSFFCMARTGSRGPFVTLCVLILLWVFVKTQNKVTGMTFVSILFLLVYLFQDFFLQILENISPVLTERLESENSSGRDSLYTHALSLFYDSPFWGASYVVDGFYSHNIFLDALMGMGIFGGITLGGILLVCLKKFNISIKQKDEYRWIHLLLMQAIIGAMFSGAFYYSALLSMMIVIVFLLGKYKMKNDKYG